MQIATLLQIPTNSVEDNAYIRVLCFNVKALNYLWSILILDALDVVSTLSISGDQSSSLNLGIAFIASVIIYIYFGECLANIKKGACVLLVYGALRTLIAVAITIIGVISWIIFHDYPFISAIAVILLIFSCSLVYTSYLWFEAVKKSSSQSQNVLAAGVPLIKI
eukprot:TRINITY_DN8049_c0_g1_i4.p1 TRINITY_DN8049_c0_g1~~TRINITY_DN8049_c0_g1_i4.p1  ORF type:complete len:165 (-),score=12.77 TRINITY_DN8049_c0_g1_i4:91-585(-)